MKRVELLQRRIAAIRYGNPARSLSIIAVAGAYGKTTVARFLEAILRETGKTVTILANDHDNAFDTSPKHFQIELAKAKKSNVDYVIVEVTESLLHIKALEDIPLTCLILTSDSKAVVDLLKLRPEHVVVPEGFHVPEGAVEPHQRISVGVDHDAEAAINLVKLYRKGTELTMTIDFNTKLELATYFVGRANAMSLATAAAACYVLGINLTAVQEGVAELHPPQGNFTVLLSQHPYKVIIDCATTPKGLELTLDSAHDFAKRRLIVAADETVEVEGFDLLKTKADRVIIVGSGKEISHNVDSTTDAAEAAKLAARGAKQDDYVLLLGKTYAKTTEEGITYGEQCLRDGE